MAKKSRYTSNDDHFGRIFGCSIAIVLLAGLLICIAVSREDQDPRYRGRPDPQGKTFKKALTIEAPIIPIVILLMWYYYHRKDKRARQREKERQ